MDYSVFLKPELLIVVAVLVFVGLVLKRFEKLPNEFIPVILGIIGIVLACLILGFNVAAVIQGIIAAACAVYGNQTLKQATKYNNKVDAEINGLFAESNTYDSVTTPKKTEETKPPDII